MMSVPLRRNTRSHESFPISLCASALTAVNSTATTTRTYDDAGRVLTDGQKITAASTTPYTVGYSYDADGRPASFVYPDGTTVGYDYNNRGEPSSVTNGGPPPVATYARNLDGSIASMTRENGVSTVNSYDNLGRLLGTSHGSPGVALGGEGYTLDAMSRRTSRTRPDGSVDTFGYDAAGQVISGTYANNAQSQTFAYDPAGNRTQYSNADSQSAVLTNYAANALNQYTAIQNPASSIAPTYNANGDLLTDGPRTYTWNGQSELTKVVSTNGGTQTSTFTYDAFHRRVSRTDAQGATYFIHDGWNVIEEYKKVGTTVLASKRYTWGDDLSGSKQGAGGVGGLLMAEELLSSTNQPLSTSVSYLYHFDGNGNVILITDATGQKAAEYQYDAFGRTLSATGTYAQTNRYRFSTKPVELGSGFYYYGYRFYDPENGRWPSRDLIEEEGGANLYEAVENAFTNSADYLGLVDPGFKKADTDPGYVEVNDPSMRSPGQTNFDGSISCACACNTKTKQLTLTCQSSMTAKITINVGYQGPNKLGGFGQFNQATVYGHEQQHIVARNDEVSTKLKIALQGIPITHRSDAECERAKTKAEKEGKKIIDAAGGTPPHRGQGGSPQGNWPGQPAMGQPFNPLPGSKNAPQPIPFPGARP